jgi:hypothetical protein
MRRTAAARADDDEAGALRIRDGNDLVHGLTGAAFERVGHPRRFCGVRGVLERGFRVVELNGVWLAENRAAATRHDVIVGRQYMNEGRLVTASGSSRLSK